jgi:phosphoglycolate phosphatase
MLLFDFDGTLVKDWEMVYGLWKSVANNFGAEFTKKDFREKMNPEWQRFVKDAYGTSWEKHKKLITKLVHDEYHKKIMKHQIIPELAEYLRNKEFAIITSGFSTAVKKLTEKARIKPAMIMSSIEAGTSDKTTLISMTLKRIGDKSCLYTGDTVQDVKAAKSHGLKTIAVTWGFHTKPRLEQARPDYLVTNVKQLTRILDQFETC